jgi:hypothetical protein
MGGVVEMKALLFCGIASMALSAVSAVIAAILFAVSGRRLKAQLEDEFGKKQE